jgi:hypothetical protein
MMKTFKFILQLMWALSFACTGALIGAVHGWQSHGWLGAIVLGAMGFGVGAALGSSPLLSLQLFQ